VQENLKSGWVRVPSLMEVSSDVFVLKKSLSIIFEGKACTPRMREIRLSIFIGRTT